MGGSQMRGRIPVPRQRVVRYRVSAVGSGQTLQPDVRWGGHQAICPVPGQPRPLAEANAVPPMTWSPRPHAVSGPFQRRFRLLATISTDALLLLAGLLKGRS